MRPLSFLSEIAHSSPWFMVTTWWRHGIRLFSALLSLFRGIHWSLVDPPSKMTSNMKLWCLICCYPEQAVKQKFDAMTFIWRPSRLVMQHISVQYLPCIAVLLALFAPTNSPPPPPPPPDKIAAPSETIFSDAFSWMKSFKFWLKFHWDFFLKVQLTITQHWFR